MATSLAPSSETSSEHAVEYPPDPPARDGRRWHLREWAELPEQRWAERVDARRSGRSRRCDVAQPAGRSNARAGPDRPRSLGTRRRRVPCVDRSVRRRSPARSPRRSPASRRTSRSTRRRSPRRCTARRRLRARSDRDPRRTQSASAVARVGARLRRARLPSAALGRRCRPITSSPRSPISTGGSVASAASTMIPSRWPAASTATPASCCAPTSCASPTGSSSCTPRERQGPRRREGRAQDQVEVRRPARADEPREAAAVPGPRTRHRQPGRGGRSAVADVVVARPHVAGPGRGRGGRSVVARTRTEPAALPDARRSVAHDRRAPVAAEVAAFYWKLLANEGMRPELDRCIRCGEGEPDVALVAFDLNEGGVLCRTCRSGQADQPDALCCSATSSGDDSRRRCRRTHRPRRTRWRRWRPKRSSSTSNAA